MNRGEQRYREVIGRRTARPLAAAQHTDMHAEGRGRHSESAETAFVSLPIRSNRRPTLGARIDVHGASSIHTCNNCTNTAPRSSLRPLQHLVRALARLLFCR